MKLKFKQQQYQNNAVDAVADCFEGQTKIGGLTYRLDPGNKAQSSAFDEGFKNADFTLGERQILENIQNVQRRQNLPISQGLDEFKAPDRNNQLVAASAGYRRDALAATRIHLDIEMETGTGKTYCYIKTIFELNQRYGWSKFIIMAPSIAIREGVQKTLQITADHFAESYGKKIRFFTYNSRRLHELESFSSDAGINVMVINIQAFNASGKDNRRIYEELDDFQSRKPIEVIAANRPILILDEPQKMEGPATMKALPQFRPLFILRYSATHKTRHNCVHRLDALDAYNQKLVKKIAVRGIQTRGLPGTNSYLYLEGIEISRKAPLARIEMEVRLQSGEIKRRIRRLENRDDLFALSGELDQYRGFTISQIDYTTDSVEFTNGLVLRAGEASGDIEDRDIRRIQIRETIKAHFDREKQLFPLGIKVLSLFFIDEVSRYRDYGQPDEKGDYARIFEEEYALLREEYLAELALDNEQYRAYLAGIDASRTHNGYFAIDKKTNRLKNPETGARSADSDDVDAYDLILKAKEKLLSFEEPTRFIFSHSALREGWDNPNVFVMCMLKHSDNNISRRQEVGRGLRLCVDRHGDRVDNPAIVHEINVLTVVASESYKDFVSGLQQEVAETLSSRPRQADESYFAGKIIETDKGAVEITAAMAKQIYRYLVKHDYTDETDHIADAYHKARDAGTLAALPDELKPYEDQIVRLIDSVFSDAQLPGIEDARKPKTNLLNANFEKAEFQALWSRLNKKAIYRVEFDTEELIDKCVGALNSELKVKQLRYTVVAGMQRAAMTQEDLFAGRGFGEDEQASYEAREVTSGVKYDLVGKLAEKTVLTRQTIARILVCVEAAIYTQFRSNPEHFISEAARLINQQKAAAVIERLSYDAGNGEYGVKIFTDSQSNQDFSRASRRLKNHVFDHAILDSQKERDFVEALDNSAEVTVYAKLPRGFLIPTPVGDYNPDWAICFREGSVKHIYFVAETKGSLSSLELRGIEDAKIKCARKFFDEMSQRIEDGKVRYGVVRDFGDLMDLVRAA
jgi:type III restriction enzyme